MRDGAIEPAPLVLLPISAILVTALFGGPQCRANRKVA